MTAPRRLLVLAPAFVPHPSPSGHRARFVARYARANGWEAEVLSVRPERFEEVPDFELERLLPADLRVTRTDALPLRATRAIGFGDIGLRSYFAHRRALAEIARERRPDLIYIYGPSFYPYLLGVHAKKKYGIPFVVDYTDPWVPSLPAWQDTPKSKAYWAREVAKKLEPLAVREAAHIFAVSDLTNEPIRQRNPMLPADRFSAVPFGFEPTDYQALRAHPRANKYWDTNDGNVHFVYAGAMLPLGYETLRALFRGVLALKERDPKLFARVRVHFFGTTYDPNGEPLVLPIAREMGLGDQVTEHAPRIPYIDALNVLTSANGVLALGSSEVHYTASKIFPCLLSTRPLLAIYHEASNVCDTVRAAETGELVTYNDVERAESRAEQIATAIQRIADPANAYPPAKLDGIRKFAAETLVGQMYQVMNTLVSPAVEAQPAAMELAHA